MSFIDKTDKRILEVLQKNARISNQDLAAAVGLSPSPCLRRVQRLEKEGVITGHITLLDPKKIGLGLTVLVHVTLSTHTPEMLASFESEIIKHEEVLECLLVTGQAYDYQLKIVVENLDAYEKLLLHSLTSIKGVTGVHSSFVLRKVIDSHALSLRSCTS